MGLITPKKNFPFEDLQKAVGEFGVSLKRPAFISEKAPLKRSNLKKPSDQ